MILVRNLVRSSRETFQVSLKCTHQDAAARTFSRTFSSSIPRQNLNIGFVPEHFSTPLHFAQTSFSLPGKLVPFPSGTGHMIQSLKSGEIDVGIGLTEAFVAGLASSHKDVPDSRLPYRIIGSYVASPLCWAISAGAKSGISNVEQLRNGKIGVSRIGSGSYVMPFVLADDKGWLEFGRQEGSLGEEIDKDQLGGGEIGTKNVGKEEYMAPAAHASEGKQVSDAESSSKPPFEFIPLQTFEKLRAGVNDGEIDAFMWEYFTSKKYYDSGEIKQIGQICTPWASWKIVARDPREKALPDMFTSITKGIQEFKEKQEEAVKYISTSLDYTDADARAWLDTVTFASDVGDPVAEDLEKTYEILVKAGVINSLLPVEDMHTKVS
jgi:hypothetical protein